MLYYVNTDIIIFLEKENLFTTSGESKMKKLVLLVSITLSIGLSAFAHAAEGYEKSILKTELSQPMVTGVELPVQNVLYVENMFVSKTATDIADIADVTAFKEQLMSYDYQELDATLTHSTSLQEVGWRMPL